MDLAYDHLAEQAYNPLDRATTPTPATKSASGDSAATPTPSSPRQSLQVEFQETFKAFSNSPWGAKLGGLWGNVRKQGESLYEEARKEAVDIGKDMEALRLKGAKGLGLGFGAEEGKEPGSETATDRGAGEATESNTSGTGSPDNKDLQDTETFLARFKAEAAKRLKEVQKAEDAADEALLRFGTNIRNFLQDAISVTGPDDQDAQPGEVLFESKDGSSGKRVIHTSRFDAQLHVIHTTLTSFTADPSGVGGQWDDFKHGFDIDKMTSRIAEDLDKYVELRASMEKLVPEKVEYKDFWTRYYFLRHVVETQEEKRKELLRASANDNAEEIAWDEDSDDEASAATAPQNASSSTPLPKVLVAQNTNDSSTTLHQQPPPTQSSSSATDAANLRPGRRSHDEKSVADSDASYDLVSGATSRAPGSPKDSPTSRTRADESDEEDWE